MATIFFITEKFIKNQGIITSNVDVTDFTPLVQYCAKAFIKKQIGSYFFDDLLVKYNNQTLSADETALVERMQYAILWRVCANATITLSYQLKNKGVMRQSGDNETSAEFKEVTFLYDHYISQSDYFQAELKTYILANKDLFPIYLDELNKDSIIKLDEFNIEGDNYNESSGIIII